MPPMSQLCYKCLFVFGGHSGFNISQMPQVVFTAIFIGLILLAIVIIIVQLKVCKNYKNCNFYFSF